MVKNKEKMMQKIITAMSIVTFGAGLVNISEAAIGRIPSISSRNHGMMQDRNNDRVNRNNRNNRRNDNQVTAPREDASENVNVNNNDAQPQETTVTNKNENNNSNIGGRRNDISSRRRETPAKIVRDIDRTHDATYDEDDRYKAQRESYFEDDGNGRIVDEQREVVEERRQVSATESDRERGRETIINRYDDEDGRRGSRGSRGNRDNSGITVVVNNNIPIENNINVDVKAENKNENKNDIKVENNTEVTSTNNNNNDNTNKTEANVSGGAVGGASSESKTEQKPTQNPETTPAAKVLWGDVNSNSRIDEIDMQLIIDYIVGAISKNDLDVSVADLNSDGQIDNSDAICIKKYLLGHEHCGRTGTEKK